MAELPAGLPYLRPAAVARRLLGAGAFVNLLATSDPITRGFEKTGEAF